MQSSHIEKSLQEMIMFQELLMFSNVPGELMCVKRFFFSQDSSPDPCQAALWSISQVHPNNTLKDSFGIFGKTTPNPDFL